MIGGIILISIHTLHTEGDPVFISSHPPEKGISIHTLHTEGDALKSTLGIFSSGFQSTPSTRRVTYQKMSSVETKIISIHTLHTEGHKFSVQRY